MAKEAIVKNAPVCIAGHRAADAASGNAKALSSGDEIEYYYNVRTLPVRSEPGR
jgi:hypothetical protein